jgi:PAS domain S-box-containing protein
LDPQDSAERQFRLLADNAPVMIWRSDPGMGCDFFNKPWLDFTGRTFAQECGDGWAEGVHPDDLARCLAIYTGAFKAREEFSMVYRLRRHDGIYRYLLDNGRPYRSAAGEFAGYFGSCVDVTEMHEAQARLGAAHDETARLLREKDLLLHELHHRVRNNMQLIGSILTLQGEGARSEDAREILRAVATRVRAIALAQERLLRDGMLVDLDLAEYLESLVAGVRLLTPRQDVRIELACEPAPLDLETAVPMGLVINELLTNAVRHAFPAGRAGLVQVAGRSAAGQIEITVQDDGIGLPEGAADRLGLKLVRRLVRQAGAELTSHGGNGLAYRLSVPGTKPA